MSAITMAIEAIERGSSTAPVVECLKAALEQDGAREEPEERPAIRHKWGEPTRPDEHHTIRVCAKCGVQKVGRHEDAEHWSEFQTASGRRIECEGTPICPGRR